MLIYIILTAALGMCLVAWWVFTGEIGDTLSRWDDNHDPFA